MARFDIAAALTREKKKAGNSLRLPNTTATEADAASAQPVVNQQTASNTPQGFEFTPGVTPAAQALGQATMGAANQVRTAAAPVAAPTSIPAASTPEATARTTRSPNQADIPEPGGFDYSGMTRSRDQIGDEARARAAMQIDTRAVALKDALANYKANAVGQRKGQMTNLAGMEEGNRYRFAGSNLGTSGFMAGANAVAQGQTQDNIGQIDQGEQQMVQSTGNQLAELEKLRGSIETATLADLERMNNDVQFKGADLNSIIQGRNLDMTGQRLRMPLELQGMGLANESATLGLERGRGLLPYELGNAEANLQRNQGMLPYDLGNAALGYQRNGLMLPLDVQNAQLGVERNAIGNDQARLGLDTSRQMQPYQVDAAKMANDRSAVANRMALLEETIATDPNVGRRRQAEVQLQTAQKQLEQMDAAINAQNALANQRTSGKPASGKPAAVDADSVTSRWGLDSLGLTTNYPALDKVMGDVSAGVLDGATLADLEDYVKQNTRSFRANGIDPDIVLRWARANLGAPSAPGGGGGRARITPN